MINNCAVQRFGRRGEPARRSTVTVARAGIAARVVVREDYPGAAMRRGIGDDSAKREFGAPFIAFVARDVDAAGFVVDMRHPQILPRRVRVGDAAGEKGTGGCQAVELQREFGTLMAHADYLWDSCPAAHLNRLRNGSPLWISYGLLDAVEGSG